MVVLKHIGKALIRNDSYIRETLSQKRKESMKQPTISVIMPVYNTERYLGETICSLQSQTYKDFEVVFVNDDSTDGSVEILNQTASSDDRFKVYHQKKGGAGAARNFGFAKAKGEYAIFLDSDDLFSPQLLEKLLDAITRYNADIAACNFSRFDVNGRETQHEGVHTRWIPGGLKVFSYRDTPDYIMRVINPTPWNKLYRSSFIREHNLRFEEISSTNDITFASVSVAAAERVTYIPDSLVRYRIGHSGTISTAKTGKLNNVKRAVFSAVRQAKELPHGPIIQNAILSFVIDNFIFSLSRYVKDFLDEDAREFYQMVHETFNRQEFANVDPRTLHNPKQFREFCTVRKHDYDTMRQLISRRLIVSLTTYPRRIGLIPTVLESIYRQTKKPDAVVLWLASEQFPNKEEELPETLLQWEDQGKLIIRWCEDLKAHKKYVFAMQEYPDDLIVTIDDDLTYAQDTLATLYASYLLYPQAVSTVRAHLIMLDEEGQIMPYRAWIQETDACIYEPSMQLLATGGAGVLYPPHLFRKEFLESKAIMRHSPYADDLWLKAMQLASDVPVVVARPHQQLRYIPDSQDEALHLINVRQNQNDVQLRQIIQWMDEQFEPGIFYEKLTSQDCGTQILGISRVSEHLDTERKNLRRSAFAAEGKVNQLENKLKQTNAQLKKCQEEQLRTIAELTRTKQQVEAECAQLKRTQQTLQNVQQQLRQEKENAPIGRQLRNLGAELRKHEKKCCPINRWFKHAVYLLAWIPEKILAGMMYYLKNGAKHTIRKLLGK